MFKPARWRTEKNKIEALFKFQFQADQVPKVGWEEMMVTLVPTDGGRPTVRSDKAAVIDGACHWENPIYETVRFTQDPRTGKFNDKVYLFVISASNCSQRSMKSGILGEVTINLTDYAEAFKPSSVSCALKSSNTGATLHVTLHRVQADVEGRDGDGTGDVTLKKLADSNDNLRKSSSFDAMSASSSDTSSGHVTPQQNRVENNNIDQDSTSFPLSNNNNAQKPMTSSSDSIVNTNWSPKLASNGIMGGSRNSSGEIVLRETLQESDDSVSLKRQLELSNLELQTLRKRVTKENRKGQDHLKELSGIKEERNAFRRECEELKASQKQNIGDEDFPNNVQVDGVWSMLEEIKHELSHEKNLNANLCLQLQKTQEANSELILAVRDLEELLEQKNAEVSCMNRNMKSNAGTVDQEILDLNDMVEMYKRDREDIEMQMEQLALDYEILQQENHSISSNLKQTQLREQLLMQYECSAHSAIINDLEAHVEILEKELQKQAEAFESDLEALTNAKVEQEQRAIRSEEALRKTRLNNANTAERLQEELKTLSVQISSIFYTNEKFLVEREELKILLKEREISLQERNTERNFLLVQLASLREEVNKSWEELNGLKQIMDEQETVITYLNSEMKTLRVQHLNLKDSLLKDGLEKEDLKKQILKLRGDIWQNEDVITSFKIKIVDSNPDLCEEGVSKQFQS